MNERIKQLSIETRYKHPYAVGLCEDFAYFDLEQFAELIIQECIAQCTAPDTDDEWDDGVRWAAEQIRKHFDIDRPTR